LILTRFQSPSCCKATNKRLLGTLCSTAGSSTMFIGQIDTAVGPGPSGASGGWALLLDPAPAWVWTTFRPRTAQDCHIDPKIVNRRPKTANIGPTAGQDRQHRLQQRPKTANIGPTAAQDRQHRLQERPKTANRAALSRSPTLSRPLAESRERFSTLSKTIASVAGCAKIADHTPV